MTFVGRPEVTRVRVGVAVPAAGSGRRMGGVHKPFLELCGEPILLHALRPFLAEPRTVAVAVALSREDAETPPLWLTDLDARVTLVVGGATRTESVARAISALPGDVDVIAVHDAARPLVAREVVSGCVDVAAVGQGAVAGCRAVDTMKRVDAAHYVVDTPDRASLWHAHTPQVFPAAVLRRVYEDAVDSVTDDSALVERAGIRVRMVDDGGVNPKITRPDDLRLAEALMRARVR